MNPPYFSFPLPGWVRRLSADLIAVFVLAALFLALFFPVLFEGKTFFFRDMLHFGYPFKHFIWKSWQEGAVPFWNPQISAGMPFFSLYHPGVFYPPNLIFLLEDFGTAVNSYYLFHHLVLTLSVYRLARFWDLSPEASLGSAVAALLGGYFLYLASTYNHFLTAVWFPLVLLSFNRFLLGKRLADFLATVLFLTIMFLAGSLETCVFIGGILWGYAVLVVPGNSTGASFFSRTVFLRTASRTAMFAGVVLLSLGLSAIQLVPTEALMKESVRSAGMSFERYSQMSLSPSALSAMVLPENHFGFMGTAHGTAHKQFFLQSCFMGLVPLGLLLAGLFSGIKSRAFWFWGVLFFVGIFFAMARFNPLYSWIYDWVPVLKFFRFPEKFFFLSAFSLVFLVGMGLDALGSRQAEKRIHIGASFLAVFVLLVLLVWVAVAEPDREWVTGLLTLLILTVLFTFASTATRGVVAFRILAVSLLILDLWVRNVSLLPMVDRSFYEKSPEVLTKLENNLYRVYGGRLLDDGYLPPANQFPARKSLMASHLALKNLLRPNLGMIYGLSYADGLTGLELKAGWLWTEIFIRSPPEKRIRILQRSNVRYWVKDNYRSGFSGGTGDVETFSSALPRAFLVNIGRNGRAPHLLNTYYDAAFNPLKEVLLNEKITWLQNEDFSGRVEQIEYGPNRVRVETNQNAEGMLVLLDTYFPGWKVAVDGQQEKIYRANYFYRGVKLGAGRHVVEFSYTPEGFQMGMRISFLTLVFLLAGPVFFHFRNAK